uniref:Uncharacterized protein n=1 Tax=Rhodnius prolixus TaxID=13249 RepID=T1HZY1_RHOPR
MWRLAVMLMLTFGILAAQQSNEADDDTGYLKMKCHSSS